MLIEKVSPITGKVHKLELPVTEEKIAQWKSSGTTIQDAFPELTPDEREFLLTGITSDEWDSLFDIKGREMAAQEAAEVSNIISMPL